MKLKNWRIFAVDSKELHRNSNNPAKCGDFMHKAVVTVKRCCVFLRWLVTVCHSVSPVFVINSMSDTEDDFDDEDLSAPPRHIHNPVKPSVVAVKTQDAEADETQDEEEEDLLELSPSQFRTTLKRKKGERLTPQKNTTVYAAIVRRSPKDGKHDLC